MNNKPHTSVIEEKQIINSTADLPAIIFGTSSLGNLYIDIPYEKKLALIEAAVKNQPPPVVFDSAGKYGAGLSLEVLGRCLKELNISPSDVIISNKLGWLRTALKTAEPTFEPGVWKNLEHDAVQKISYNGILECFEQGNELLDAYAPQLLSVHDPDEYLDAAINEEDKAKRYDDILEAYRALNDLKQKGLIKAIGVGAKNWKIIQRIVKDVQLDWVMIANSMTIHSHPDELISFIMELNAKGIDIINSAVFNGGFLTGSDFYNYKPLQPGSAACEHLYKWREAFYEVCTELKVQPAAACAYFGLHIPGVKSIALNSSSPARVKDNIDLVSANIPAVFWQILKSKKLINPDYPFL